MLILRSVIHYTRCFRPPLTTAPTTSFTTSVARMESDPQAYTDLFGVLTEESKKMEEKDDPISSKGSQSYGPKEETIRVVLRNKPLHPSQFSRERRVISRRHTPKPWHLGPPTKVARSKDPFHQMGINPLDECMNSTLLSHYVSSMGRIEKRNMTNLTSKSQRKLSKAIKRAKMMGIMPIHGRAFFGLTRFPK